MSINSPFTPTSTAPTGQENTGVVRSIARKQTTIETTIPLAANATFTGQWHDSQADGTFVVACSSFSDQPSINASGCIIQQSDDIGNPNLTINVGNNSGILAANTVHKGIAVIKGRYWRITYKNGATAQGKFELTTCSLSGLPYLDSVSAYDMAGVSLGPTQTINFNASGAGYADNLANSPLTNFSNGVGNGTALLVYTAIFGGAFSGTPNAALQNWSKPRTPTIFKQVTATASGNTAIWTPGTGNKFRLLRFKIQVTGDATQSVAGRITIGLQDATTDVGLSQVVYVPGAITTPTINDYDSGWIDLGTFGILSASANNVLNINLSAALAAGVVNVIVCGTEE